MGVWFEPWVCDWIADRVVKKFNKSIITSYGIHFWSAVSNFDPLPPHPLLLIVSHWSHFYFTLGPFSSLVLFWYVHFFITMWNFTLPELIVYPTRIISTFYGVIFYADGLILVTLDPLALDRVAFYPTQSLYLLGLFSPHLI